MEVAARTLTLLLIEPQSCFAGAFARLLGAFAPGTIVQTYDSLDAAGDLLRHADVVVYDVDPGNARSRGRRGRGHAARAARRRSQ